MPLGSKSGGVVSKDNGAQDRPVVFQKYFKSGSRTYASQIKIANNGHKYLVLTEGVRDEQTQEVKKKILRVFDQDLKDFFAMLQETVVYLRNTKDVPVSAPVAKPAGPVPPVPGKRVVRPQSAYAAPKQVAQAKKPAVARPVAGKPVPKVAPKATGYSKAGFRSAPSRASGR